MRVLVAEDDVDFRDLLEIAVASLNHDVRSARDGREAWEILQQEGADVVISDWLMPHMQGTELCRLVRAMEGVPYVYFVILTALDSEEHMLQGMQAGADDYLAKPFTIGALQARLVRPSASRRSTGRWPSGTPSAPSRSPGTRPCSESRAASPPKATLIRSCAT